MANRFDRYGFVYLVTNKINGKRYVGKTVMTISIRWSAHVSHATQRNYPMALHAAIRKHGAENFAIEKICEAKENLLIELERFFIKYFNTKIECGYGYNMTDGGDGASGLIPTEETRKKMSSALIGNKRASGRKMTEANKLALLEASKRREFNAETRKKMSEAQKGKKHSPETGRKISAANTTTHCKWGHLRTVENTYVGVRKSGYPIRVCRECRLKVNRNPSRGKGE